jgi:hypothetical protein
MVFRTNPILSFIEGEKAGITAFGLFMIISGLLVGAYSVDWSNLMAARTQLQVAADAAAHAALVKREFSTEAEAKEEAVRIAVKNMPVEKFGQILSTEDVSFGIWDQAKFTFSESSGSKSAVRVRTHRIDERGNSISTFLLRLVGVNSVPLTREAVFATYYPTCLREGFVAQDVVDLQSNNSFTNGFCVHSNAHVSLNSNNYFEPGTVVSMPNEEDIELPSSGYDTNTGLSDALRSGSWHIRILKQLDYVIDALESDDPEYHRSFVTSPTPVLLPDRNIDQEDLIAGRIHTFTWSGGAALTVKNDVLVSNVVIVTDCDVKFGAGVVIQDAVIATRSTDKHSMTASSGLQVGRNDNCASGGDAQLLTLGSMDFPSDLKIYGSQLIALGDISFAANADGIQGAALVAGGQISGTSNMSMGFCGTGMENNIQAEYFKLTL